MSSRSNITLPGKIILVSVLVLSGCATLPPVPAPYTLKEITGWAEARKTPVEMLALLRETRTVYDFSATELVAMGKAGVPNEVLDYLQASLIAAVRRDERRRAQLESDALGYRYGFGYGYGHGYGFGPWYRPGIWGFRRY